MVALGVVGVNTFAHANDELLEAEKAFALSADTSANDSVIVRWDIADGYYMYRDKFSFTIQSPDTATLGDAEFEQGKIKADELFGDVEVYEGSTEIRLPVAGVATDLKLEITGQGCNEPIGVCYPPLTQVVALQFEDGLAQGTPGNASNLLAQSSSESTLNPKASTVDDAPKLSIDSLKSLNGLLGNDGPEFLDVDDAFKLSLEVDDSGVMQASFIAADGYYLYRDQISLRAADADLAKPDFPAGVDKTDETYGNTVVYYGDFQVPVEIRSLAQDDRVIDVEATYQGCAEDAICYPPVTRSFSVALPAALDVAALLGAGNAGSTPSGGALAAGDATGTGVEGDGFAGKSFWGLILAAFGVGLLLTFTPCVLPLIPILSGIIAGQGENVTRARGGLLAIAYVLGTAVTYAVIGWVAGATGEQLQAYFQNVWAIGTIAVVFVIMSLSMFGLFNIEVPAFIQSRIQNSTQSLGGGVLGGTFALGMASALIVGACVSPLLIAALSVAIARGDALLGASMMVAMALGMGVFLVIIGYGAGALLPKAGAWMDRVKQGFGVMLLAVAIYLLQVIPEVPVLLLWSALFIVVAVYLGATQALPEGASGWRYLFKGVGTIMLVWGIAAMLGGFSGQRDILNPLPGLGGSFDQSIAGAKGVDNGVANGRSKPDFIQVRNESDFEQAFADATASGRYVLLDYYADWCTDCKRMEANTLSDPLVKKEIDARFVMLQVDVTDPKDQDSSAMKKRFGVFGPPAMLFFDPAGKEIASERLYGYRNVEQFLKILSRT